MSKFFFVTVDRTTDMRGIVPNDGQLEHRTFADMTLLPDDRPEFDIAVVEIPTTSQPFSFPEIVGHLRMIRPQSILICVYRGSPSDEQVEKLRQKVTKAGANLCLCISEVNPRFHPKEAAQQIAAVISKQTPVKQREEVATA